MTVAETLSRTPLADWHSAHGGRMVDFAGWLMPVQYGSITAEHVATRTAVGLFDVSHMGRMSFVGPQAAPLLDLLLTRRASALAPGQVRYGLACNESGGALDDVLVGRAANDTQGTDYGLVVNAGNRVKLWDWFNHQGTGFDAQLDDHTQRTAMIAVQGPNAVAMLARMTDAPLGAMRYYTSCVAIDVGGVNCSASRTGYTGEDGFELICAADDATSLWQALIDAGGKPCGLASRDTLRLEAAMPLYGHELLEEITPLEAGLGFAVNFDGADGAPRDFVGSGALRAQRDAGVQRVRVGLAVEGKRPPREGYTVLDGDAPVGTVTSGTASPTLGRGIAMAMVPPTLAAAGTRLAVDVRGAASPATVVPLPFYKRPV
ncbi:MAG: glycine cleavage system aminomethyltransferase GcvT [Lacipirellulaceae bacterium]